MSRFPQSIIFSLLLLAGSAFGQTASYEQTIDLQPGWNAVYFQVEPDDNRMTSVFADVPVASVWRWLPTGSGVSAAQFVQDPAEGLENIEGWFAWFPEPRPEAFLSNLFRVNANTAYLIRIAGSASHQITVAGRPQLLPLRWETDAFTLTGLPVAAQNAPTFGEFFSGSAAHQNQPAYQLDADGRWQVVSPASTQINSGEAYWIFTAGNSNYQGRMDLVLDQGESLEYAAALEEIRFVLRNRSELPGSFQVRRIAGNAMPLAFRNVDIETGEVGWPSLPSNLVLDVSARDDVFVTLGVVRRDFSATRMEEILEITDEFGERLLLHVGGNTLQPFVAPTRSNTRMAEGAALAGLWLGEVEVDAVSESQLAGVVPETAPQTFSQRFLLHVDSAGQVRLLKDVIQMWEEGTVVPSDEDPSLNEVDEPGRLCVVDRSRADRSVHWRGQS